MENATTPTDAADAVITDSAMLTTSRVATRKILLITHLPMLDPIQKSVLALPFRDHTRLVGRWTLARWAKASR
jgi:hypothetical protein